MDIKEVKAFLEENKDKDEVKAFYAELQKVSIEQEKDITDKWVQSIDGKKHIQVIKDQEVAKAIETWKENNLTKLVEAEVDKLNPPENPEVVKLNRKVEEIQKEADMAKREAMSSQLRSSASEFLNQNKIPVDFASFVVGKDEEATTEKLAGFKDILDAHMKEVMESRFKDIGRDTPDTDNNTVSGKIIKRADFMKLPPLQQAEKARDTKIID